jgi:phenylalanyl-tRNA synthetase beta chain
MKISYNWLKQFIKLDWEAEKAGELLTDLGLEVEGIDAFSSILGGLEGIVVGHVVACEPHPNADRLKLTKVDVGDGNILQIVCGAPNVDKGQNVPVATIGTTLYDAEGKPWQIKKGKIRGEESQGMICAEDELGLGKNHDGIMILDKDLKPGTLLSTVLDVENDEVFEIGLTPNRADAMSHWGVARDLKAGLLQQNISIELITPSTTNFKIESRTLKIDVNVENISLAPRYCGVTISGLKVAESPIWLKNRLKAIGLSPINNLVDCTNYVLHELGQPLHAFDASKIIDNTINVQTLAAGTKFTTLDGIERELHEEDLMICDAEKPLCIAGVFGGLNSGVSESTTSIFLESAYFDPISVRKTAKRHGLNTDASFRFERGIDPNITEYALMHAAVLITKVAGGFITSELIDKYPKKIEDHQVFLNYEKTTALIGEEIHKEKIKQILTSLDIKVNNVTETGIGMTIPAFRNDVTREADVIEEILRVYGYNNIKFTEKLNASISGIHKIEDYQIQNKIGALLTSIGFNEMLCNSLTSPKYIELSNTLNEEHNVSMLNPLSQELAVLRQSMLFGGLEVLAYNNNRKTNNVKMFEFGKTYHNYPNARAEKKHLSLIISGSKTDDSWTNSAVKSDFFYGKGVVTAILERLGIQNYNEKGLKSDLFSEGISLVKNNQILVEFGVVSKKLTSQLQVDNETHYADFHWDSILNEIETTNHLMQPMSKFPKVKRDFALLLDNKITFEDLKTAAFQTEKSLLKDVNLFDVYTGNKLPEGKKSYALSFTIQDQRKTLTDKQVDKIMNKLQKRFENDFGASLR